MFNLFMFPPFALTGKAFRAKITTIRFKTHMNVLMMHKTRRTTGDVRTLNLTIIYRIPINDKLAVIHVAFVLFQHFGSVFSSYMKLFTMLVFKNKETITTFKLILTRFGTSKIQSFTFFVQWPMRIKSLFLFVNIIFPPFSKFSTTLSLLTLRINFNYVFTFIYFIIITTFGILVF